MNWYVFCDICGKRCLASQTTLLSKYTGRPGLRVCPKDVDAIDYGQVPYTIPIERSVPWIRTNHEDVAIGSPYVDAMRYSYWIVTSQDESQVIAPSQDTYTGLTVTESF